MSKRIRASQISYFDSKIIMWDKEKFNSTVSVADDGQSFEKTPIEILLEKITRNLYVLRRDYMGNRTPKYL